ncbi:leucine-rich repeat domain-containing protein [Hoylesella buccalis]|uniref:leucine-rich repeat protein n=1 Tax=Hoylesella buccalis TaxID=28127 RepID=UPI001D13BA93|nr:leucine-rich repeat protein [Hoylesella buccalis]UEA63284.1 leucine-rich repeat domain-containing protein [Hoylesella buccalis]UWP49425.1 leucine-rich repeat domain-containing protein [Hoylesella buccalis ATCC 35310]
MGYQAFKGAKIDITTAIPATAKIGELPEDNKIKAMYNNLPAGTDQRSGVESFAEFSGSVSLAEGPTTIPTGMFEKAFTNLSHFLIPFSVVNSIDERAFSNAGILSFNALSEVKRIGARAFENGVMSGDFVIGDQVEEVGDGAFAGNTKLEAFILKGSANCKIGVEILEGCPNLEFVDLRNVKNEDFKKNLKNLSREFNSHTITSGLPTHTLVFLPEATDITIADGQDVNFVKSDGTCTKLSLQDGMEYEFLCDIKANQAVYNRCNMTINKTTIDRGYNTPLEVAHYEGDNSLTSYREFSKFADGKHCFTIFLPYAVTLPEGIRAYELRYKNKKEYFTDGIKDDEFPQYPNGYPLGETQFYVFNSIPDGSTLEASRPYLLRITDGNNHTSEKFTANNVEIAKSPEKFGIVDGGRLKPVGFPATSSEQSYSFQGSTEKIPAEAYGHDRPYVLNIVKKHTIEGLNKEIDVWRQMKYENKGSNIQNPSIPPFRGFVNLLPGASSAKQFMVLSEGETTGISSVTENADAQQGAQRIYTIDGRYVGTNFDSLPSGMYIMKGKKTLKTK